MREYQFIQVDVFTDKPFGGNPLAVFPDAEGLTGDEMQAIAREMNLSETVFVLPARAADALFRIRIFTPAAELPFAGHPVVGTHWILARLGRVDLAEPVTTSRLEMGVGVLPADIHVSGDRVRRVVMTQDRPRLRPPLDDIGEVAEGLGLNARAVLDTGLPAEVVSTGISKLIVPVRSLGEVRALDPAAMNVSALARALKAAGAGGVTVFSTETESPGATVHVRVFAPTLGVPEDPATGSACGCLGAYLVRHSAVPIDTTTVHIRCEQGLEMGRPSAIDVEVDHEDGVPEAVRVGGEVVEVCRGVLRF